MDTVVFLHLFRALAISYLLACIVFYCGKRWIKVLFYAIGLMLFSVNLMVWLVFHKTFSPQIFVLLGETNYREATEFVKTFLLQGRGLICLFIIAVVMSMIILTEKKWPIRGHRRHLRIISSVILVCSLLGFFYFDIYYDICKSHTFEDLNVGNRFPYDSVTATALALHDVRAVAHEMKHAILLTKKRGWRTYHRDGLFACNLGHWRVLYKKSCSDLWLLSAHYTLYDAGKRKWPPHNFQ